MLKTILFTLLFSVNAFAVYRCRVGNTLYNCADIYTTSTTPRNIITNNISNSGGRNFSQTKVLPAHAFAATPELDALDLSQNNFTKLISDVFADLRNLQILTIANSSLKQIEPGAFNGLQSLQELRLQQNHFNKITKSLIQDLHHLKVLNLSENLISDIEHHAFENMAALQALDLSKNHLQNLQLNMFYGLTALESLFLQHNGLTQMHPFSFIHMTELRDLELSHNSLTILPDEVFRSSSKILRKLNLSNNNIANLQPRLFDKLMLLEELDLQKNIIKNVPGDALIGLANLKTLILSYNIIEELPASFIDPCVLIEDLQINNNRITFWPSGSRNPLMHLTSVKIEANPWQCPCLREVVLFLVAKRISYVDELNFAKLSTCVPTAVSFCVRDMDKVKEHQIVEKYEAAIETLNR